MVPPGRSRTCRSTTEAKGASAGESTVAISVRGAAKLVANAVKRSGLKPWARSSRSRLASAAVRGRALYRASRARCTAADGASASMVWRPSIRPSSR